MIDSTRDFGSTELERPSARAISVREALGWLAAGVGTLVVTTLVGVFLQTWWTAAWLSRRDLSALAGAMSSVYVPLLVTPLAVGVAIALTMAAPLTTLVSDRTRTVGSRILLSVSVFVPIAFVYWLVGGALAKGVSAPMAQWLGDVRGEVFEHYYYASYVPQNTIWSLAESIVLVVAILVVYAVMILRRPFGERSPLPRAVAGVVVVTIVVGALFAGNAVRAYHDLGLFGG